MLLCLVWKAHMRSPASHFKQDGELCGRSKVAQVNLIVMELEYLETCYISNGCFVYCFFFFFFFFY